MFFFLFYLEENNLFSNQNYEFDDKSFENNDVYIVLFIYLFISDNKHNTSLIFKYILYRLLTSTIILMMKMMMNMVLFLSIYII